MDNEAILGEICSAIYSLNSDESILRDRFAGQAMSGLLASPNTDLNDQNAVARDAYAMAQAMLAERAKYIRK